MCEIGVQQLLSSTKNVTREQGKFYNILSVIPQVRVLGKDKL